VAPHATELIAVLCVLIRIIFNTVFALHFILKPNIWQERYLAAIQAADS